MGEGFATMTGALVAGTVAAVLTHPADTLKTRLQEMYLLQTEAVEFRTVIPEQLLRKWSVWEGGLPEQCATAILDFCRVWYAL